MSESSSNKLISKMSIDRLPDPILCHILSFLDIKEAAITSTLSKRWQFLWNDFPNLVLRERGFFMEVIRDFVARVHRTLVICCRNNLDRFEVEFQYHLRFSCDVNVWIDFAVKKKVKNVHLRLLNGDGSYHVLPQMIFSNPSMTSFLIQGCIFAPRRNIEWQSLTELHIEETELGDRVIEKIFSGCPVLRSLELDKCWGFNRVEVSSASVYKLVIDVGKYEVGENEQGKESLMEISAPYLLSLKILMYQDERRFRFTNMASLVRADFCFSSFYMNDYVEFLSMVKDLYESIAHVKELVVDKHWFKALSMLVVNGWRLPQSKQVCLTVNDLYGYENNIFDIMGVLESCPRLETLIIKIKGFPTKKSITWHPPTRDDLDWVLLNLKMVRITDSGKPCPDSGLVLNLARILLKRAFLLEKMVIVLDYKDLSDVVMISKALIAYPRSSLKTLVELR